MNSSIATTILSILHRAYKDHLAEIPSTGRGSPFEVLILTILSAQTTDQAVDRVRPTLFERFPTPDALATAEIEEVEAIIHSLGFFHMKARHIIAASRMLLEKFGGEVPRTMEDLLMLPGVGRKTANIVLYHAFGYNVGIAVDTHVKRLARRIGFTNSDLPDQIEQDLREVIPQEEWGHLTDLFIAHGRTICTARDPACPVCPIQHLCRYYVSLQEGTDKEK
jgi:endonuclease-3